MLRHIDHIVILVQDLAQASADYTAAGFTVTPGGIHAAGMTHNALVGFADGVYLELIAFTQPETEQPHRWWRRLAKGEGFVDYALLSDDLGADAAAIRTRDLAAAPPEDGGRTRPDGQFVGWRNLQLSSAPARMALPFLIEDTTPRELRVPGGSAAAHPNGATGVQSFTLLVTDLPAAVRRLAAVLDHPGAPEPHERGDAHRFHVGPHSLLILHPTDPDSDPAHHLQTFGDSPYELTLTGPTAIILPLDKTHGARIRITH